MLPEVEKEEAKFNRLNGRNNDDIFLNTDPELDNLTRRYDAFNPQHMRFTDYAHPN